jgi:hypothetical protein
MSPRLAIFRFPGVVEGRDDKRIEVRRAAMEKKTVDHDEACLNLWRAFRSNPYYKNLGTFVIVHESGGAIFVGPKVKVGAEASKAYYVNQLLPTIAKILGYDPNAFVAPASQPAKKPPIDELFE